MSFSGMLARLPRRTYIIIAAAAAFQMFFSLFDLGTLLLWVYLCALLTWIPMRTRRVVFRYPYGYRSRDVPIAASTGIVTEVAILVRFFLIGGTLAQLVSTMEYTGALAGYFLIIAALLAYLQWRILRHPLDPNHPPKPFPERRAAVLGGALVAVGLSLGTVTGGHPPILGLAEFMVSFIGLMVLLFTLFVRFIERRGDSRPRSDQGYIAE